MTLYPEIRKERFTKDFSWGFYCTNILEQAIRWANRGKGEPVINYFEYEPKKELNILSFDTMDDAWLDFIAHCRSGKTHPYDVVEGPMANDTVWNYVNDFMGGNLTREQFWCFSGTSARRLNRELDRTVSLKGDQIGICVPVLETPIRDKTGFLLCDPFSGTVRVTVVSSQCSSTLE